MDVERSTDAKNRHAGKATEEVQQRAKEHPSGNPGPAAHSPPHDNDVDGAGAVLEDLEELRAKASQRDEYLELLRRTQADFENYRKRVQRDSENERRYAAVSLIRDLLPVIDNLERALEAGREAHDVAKLIAGIELVHQQWTDALSRHGVEPIAAVGQPFDPTHHEAVAERVDTSVPDKTVLEEYQKGYRMYDRVLRASKVVVSRKPEPADKPQGQSKSSLDDDGNSRDGGRE
jgi:molecular chaperone GrpE